MRAEFQSYLDRVYPGSRVDTRHSLLGPVHIRFELGGELKNGTRKRVNKAVDRATTLFHETFIDAAKEIWLLVYEDLDRTFSSVHLRQLFSPEQFSGFYRQAETLNSPYIATDEHGNEAFETYEGNVIIGKLPVKASNITAILTGIANNEMGFEPALDQRIYFFDPSTNRAFHMYDDRGCYVWSNNAENIRPLYENRNSWIVDHHRPEIEEYFR